MWLQIAMEELAKAKMDVPPKGTMNELPTLPFGLEIQPSIQELIAKRGEESFDEHFRKNAKGGKAAFYKKRGLHTTPDLNRGADTRSIQSSRLSEYSTGDLSSYYDTAANSRLSLGEMSSKTSPKSSRTSFNDDRSDPGSYEHTVSRHTPVPLNEEMEVEEELARLNAEDERTHMNGDREATLTRDETLENMAVEDHGEKPPSQASEYDNMSEKHTMNGADNQNWNADMDYDNISPALEIPIEHIQRIPVQYEIPVTHELPIRRAQQITIRNSNGDITPVGSLEPVAWTERKEQRLVESKSAMEMSSSASSRQSGSRKRTRTSVKSGPHSSPNTPTYVENGGELITSPRFVSQLHIRRQGPQSPDHINGFTDTFPSPPTTTPQTRTEITVQHL